MSPQSTAVATAYTWNNPADDDPCVICCGAISNNDEKGVKAALLAGADANYEGPNGARPLALAAYVGNKAICVTLLSYGAEVTDICIQSAQAAGHIALAEYLRNSARKKSMTRQKDEAKERREAQIVERKERTALLEREEERRERGEKLVQQAYQLFDQQVRKRKRAHAHPFIILFACT